jgi:hypothetical protein
MHQVDRAFDSRLWATPRTALVSVATNDRPGDTSADFA